MVNQPTREPLRPPPVILFTNSLLSRPDIKVQLCQHLAADKDGGGPTPGRGRRRSNHGECSYVCSVTAVQQKTVMRGALYRPPADGE